MKKIVGTIAGASLLMASLWNGDVQAAEYEVKKDDTLYSIATKYDTSTQNIKEINSLLTDVIYPTQKLNIINDSSLENTTKYKVKVGDTLYSIARHFGLSVEQLKSTNGLTLDSIYADQELLILQNNSFNVKPKNFIHVVRNGENLYRISIKYNISLDELMIVNQLTDDSNITIGQKLIIPTIVEKVKEAKEEVKSEIKEVEIKEEVNTYKEIEVVATAYTAYCKGCSGITSTGINLRKDSHLKVIAVDPRIIPLGSKVEVPGYGEAIAGDIGGAIKGNKIDVFIPDLSKATNWGKQTIKIKIY